MDNVPGEKIITLNFGTKTYKFKLNSGVETFVVDSCKKINDKLKDYSQNFPNKDYQDLLAMAVITYICEIAVSPQQNNGINIESLYKELNTLSNSIEQQLKTEG